MAGSYKHIVTDQGNLVSNETFVGMIENLGDAYEMTEEMFGMIWWLAFVSRDPKPWWTEMTISERIEDARKHYKEGIRLAKMANRGEEPDERQPE